MKCPHCGEESNRFYIKRPAKYFTVMDADGNETKEEFDIEMHETEYLCVNCHETVTTETEEAKKLLNGTTHPG